MEEKWSFWVAGGDLRQARLAELLAADGHEVKAWALEGAGPLAGVAGSGGPDEAAGVHCVVLPLPAAGEGRSLNAPLAEGSRDLDRLLDALPPGQIVCAGRVDPATARRAAERGLVLRDYFAREELAVANAVPTAEEMGHCFKSRSIFHHSLIQ